MYEYKSEVFKLSARASSAGVKTPKKVDEIGNLTQFINGFASDGWELAAGEGGVPRPRPS